MARETYVLRNGKLVRKEEATPLNIIKGPYFMPDIKPFVTQDGKPIDSRSALRAYEIRNGVRQVGTDLKLPWSDGHG